MVAFRPTGMGYFGKLPARGDFVSAGLAEAFVAPWDGWCRTWLTETRGMLGEGWLDAWMEAPIWHFLLGPGVCGPLAVRGVWLPSQDKVGRHFPFMLAAFGDDVAALAGGGAWGARAEALGLACVVEDAPHEALLAALGAPVGEAEPETAGWWTEGSPLVAAKRLGEAGLPGLAGLPGAATAAAMLREFDPVDLAIVRS